MEIIEAEVAVGVVGRPVLCHGGHPAIPRHGVQLASDLIRLLLQQGLGDLPEGVSCGGQLGLTELLQGSSGLEAGVEGLVQKLLNGCRPLYLHFRRVLGDGAQVDHPGVPLLPKLLHEARHGDLRALTLLLLRLHLLLVQPPKVDSVPHRVLV